VKYEGRWSIELINDRGLVVTDFTWSHDGRMAVICYKDGFVLVGSVSGQRFWSHLYELSNNFITTATWTPNDEFIVFGISNGTLMVVDENGTIVSRLTINNTDSIVSLAYNSPKFFIDEFIESARKRPTSSALQQHQLLPPPPPPVDNPQDILNNGGCHLDEPTNGLLGGGANNLINLSMINQNRLRFSLNNFYFANGNNLNGRNESRLKNKIKNSDYLLACSFKSTGLIYLIRNLEEIDHIVIDTKLKGLQIFYCVVIFQVILLNYSRFDSHYTEI
jgi:hypothetical protein